MPFGREVGENTMSKLTVMLEKGDTCKTWNYILPKKQKSTNYNPIQSIPPLTKQNSSRSHSKGRTRKK